MYLRPPIVNFLFPVTRPHCNFRAACIFIITFDDHGIEICCFRHDVEHLCGHIVGATTIVSWCIIETQNSDMSFLVLFTVIEHESYSICYKRV